MKKILIIASLFGCALAAPAQTNVISTDFAGLVTGRSSLTYERKVSEHFSVVAECRHFNLSKSKDSGGVLLSDSKSTTTKIDGYKFTFMGRFHPAGGAMNKGFLEGGFFTGRMKLDYHNVQSYSIYSVFDLFSDHPTADLRPDATTTYQAEQRVGGLVMGAGFHPFKSPYMEISSGLGINLIEIDQRFKPTAWQMYPYLRMKMGIAW